MSYICVEPCYWGPNQKQFRTWDIGEIYEGKPLLPDGEINPHFEDMDAEENVEQKMADMKELEAMTKKEINEKYKLGLSDKDRHFTGKQVLIQMVLDKEI